MKPRVILAALLLALLLLVACAWLIIARRDDALTRADRDAVRASQLICAGDWSKLHASLTPSYQHIFRDADALRAQLEHVEGDVSSAGRIPVVQRVERLGELWRAELRLVRDGAPQQIALSLLFQVEPLRVGHIEATVAPQRALDDEPPARAARELMKLLERGDVDAAYDAAGPLYRDTYSREQHAALMAEQAALLSAPAPAIREVGYDDPYKAVVIAHHSAASGEQGIVVYSLDRRAGGAWQVAMFGALLTADGPTRSP